MIGKRGEMLDYFTNYGWLFLFLGGGVALFFTMGFFSFGLLGGSLCKFSAGWTCKDIYATTHEFGFTLISQQPTPVDINAATLVEDTCGKKITYQSVRLDYGSSYKVVFDCAAYPKVIRGEVVLEYTGAQSGLAHTEKGDIRIFT